MNKRNVWRYLQSRSRPASLSMSHLFCFQMRLKGLLSSAFQTASMMAVLHLDFQFNYHSGYLRWGGGTCWFHTSWEPRSFRENQGSGYECANSEMLCSALKHCWQKPVQRMGDHSVAAASDQGGSWWARPRAEAASGRPSLSAIPHTSAGGQFGNGAFPLASKPLNMCFLLTFLFYGQTKLHMKNDLNLPLNSKSCGTL